MRAALLFALLLAGCGTGPAKNPEGGNQSAEINAMAAEVDQIEGDVRLRRLEERMRALETQMGNTMLPEAELDLLDNRVRKLEAAEAGKRAAPAATPAP